MRGVLTSPPGIPERPIPSDGERRTEPVSAKPTGRPYAMLTGETGCAHTGADTDGKGAIPPMSLDQKPITSTSNRLPAVTYVLAAGTFLMGTTEFVVAGLLPEIARDLDVSVARAGLLITAFALGMIVGPP